MNGKQFSIALAALLLWTAYGVLMVARRTAPAVAAVRADAFAFYADNRQPIIGALKKRRP